MKVYGHLVTDNQCEKILNEFHDGMTSSEIEKFAISIGIPETVNIGGRFPIGCAHRVVDRLLQKQRKAGRTEFRNKKWYLIHK